MNVQSVEGDEMEAQAIALTGRSPNRIRRPEPSRSSDPVVTHAARIRGRDRRHSSHPWYHLGCGVYTIWVVPCSTCFLFVELE